ncbi:hypothetical protein HDC94_002364 [Leifsonia sp. AK011]|uniref:hypothetical protein n=1 Tax=Leifsonia sp. AK011 TaxID=2723075 RepID=UPI0015C84B5D|nr:hypothetical protein [Leifsonia sp. AK011]NYF11208.1 hypothetical protein [Leifsonia sp. AK011]
MRLLHLTLPIALLALLSACVPTRAAAPTPTDAATEAPLFATDEEALAAAEEVYREYSLQLRSVSSGADTGLDGIRALTTADWFEIQQRVYEEARLSGRHTEGETPLVAFRLQQIDPPNLTAYACHDYGELKVIDASGIDITPPRDRYAVFEVTLSQTPDSFVISKNELWRTGSSCSS